MQQRKQGHGWHGHFLGFWARLNCSRCPAPLGRVGHPLDRLKVGIHARGYVAHTGQQAADEFFSGYALSFTEIGKERGWPPITGRQFEALLQQEGALLVGDPRRVADKILSVSEAFGGIERLSARSKITSHL